MVGSQKELRVPVRGSNNKWEVKVYTVKVYDEIKLLPGNQRLFRIEFKDGSTGKAWENTLH